MRRVRLQFGPWLEKAFTGEIKPFLTRASLKKRVCSSAHQHLVLRVWVCVCVQGTARHAGSMQTDRPLLLRYNSSFCDLTIAGNNVPAKHSLMVTQQSFVMQTGLFNGASPAMTSDGVWCCCGTPYIVCVAWHDKFPFLHIVLSFICCPDANTFRF